MTTLQNLAKTTGQKLDRLETTAAAFGFTGSVTDELPADILAKLQGPKQLNSGSAPTEPEQPKTSTQQGLGDIHAAYFTSTANLQDSHFETEKQIAIATGKMEGHQIYLNRIAARNEALQTLVNRDLGASVQTWQEKEENYRAFIEEKRQKALSAWAASDKTGKSLQQAASEVKALIASFDI